MKKILAAMTLVLSLAGTSFPAGLPPWEFGMSASEVMSFSKFGPYNTFSNGDLETFNGIYNGKKQNIQFFFDAKGLRRIGVYLYEGKDINAARAMWRQAYESLKKKYGEIELPEISLSAGSDAADSEALSIAAAANVAAGGKTQMAPVVQPKDVSIFSSFVSQEFQGIRYYIVNIYFDSLP